MISLDGQVMSRNPLIPKDRTAPLTPALRTIGRLERARLDLIARYHWCAGDRSWSCELRVLEESFVSAWNERRRELAIAKDDPSDPQKTKGKRK